LRISPVNSMGRRHNTPSIGVRSIPDAHADDSARQAH
jgi:hypothetical protein